MDNRTVSKQRILPLDLPAGHESRRVWRPIHYLGSKLRLTDRICQLVDELDPAAGMACDLFAGSGTASFAMSSTRSVIAADIQEYSRVLCAALLKPGRLEAAAAAALLYQAEHGAVRTQFEHCLEPLLSFEQNAIQAALSRPQLLCDLVEHGSLLRPKGGRDKLALAMKESTARIESEFGADTSTLMATRYFGGVYFSFRQALYLDCVLSGIDSLSHDCRNTCLAALLSTASSIVNTVGKQFAQPLRPRRRDGTIKTHLIRQMQRDRCLDAHVVFSGWLSRYGEIEQTLPHQVVRGDYRAVLAQYAGDVSVIYADPPYTRDHYSRFYHVLETLCLRDSPGISTTCLSREGGASRGVYRLDRHQSPFCIKSQAPKAFSELFAGCAKAGAPLLLSYSPFVKNGHPRMLTVDAIREIARTHYHYVEVVPAGSLTHSKLNKTELQRDTPDEAEVFVVCRC